MRSWQYFDNVHTEQSQNGRWHSVGFRKGRPPRRFDDNWAKTRTEHVAWIEEEDERIEMFRREREEERARKDAAAAAEEPAAKRWTVVIA